MNAHLKMEALPAGPAPGRLLPHRSGIILACMLASSLLGPTAWAGSPDLAAPEIFLDIGIQVFNPGLEEDQESHLRRAEAHFIPFRLRATLETSDAWGAVRVIPEGDNGPDLIVSGTIVESRGTELAIKVRATDSTGRVWISGKYRRKARPEAYANPTQDPFQPLYDEIARDLLRARRRLGPEKLQDVRATTTLRFAADLLPTAYGDYVQARGKRHRLRRLPSVDDPMMVRLERIRTRHELRIDVLDEGYAAFVATLVEFYDEWRRSSYDQEIALREARRQINIATARLHAETIRPVVVMPIQDRNGLSYMRVPYDTGWHEHPGEMDHARTAQWRGAVARLSRRVRRHAAALHELAATLDRQVEPLVTDLDRQTLVLLGSSEAHYDQWRDMLQEILQLEVGLPPAETEPSSP